MKKTILVLFALSLVVTDFFAVPIKIKSTKKTTQTSVSKDILRESFEVRDWERNYVIPPKEFSELKPGSKIEFYFTPYKFTTYTRVFLLDQEWNNYLFSQIKCSPDANYVQQEQTDEKTKQKRFVTKISVPDYDDENDACYTVTITLNQKELQHLKQKGLLFCGNNFKLLKIFLLTEETGSKSEKKSGKSKNRIDEARQAQLQKLTGKYNVPVICITTNGGKNLKKENYTDSIIEVTNCDERYVLSALGQAKIRGNSTADDKWAPVQKPLRIKFKKKKNILGLNNGAKYKDWVLLRAEGFNASDYTGFKLAHEIYKTSEYDYYASDCEFVHVFLNDKYQGQYLLCEQNQIGSGRVDVDKNKAKSKDNKIGYMLELDNYAWEDLKDNAGRWFGVDNQCQKGKEEYHFTLRYLSDNSKENTKFMVWGYEQTGIKLTDINGESRGCASDDYTLKNKIYSDSQVVFIQKYMKNLWNICYRAIQRNEFYKFDKNYNLVKAPEFKTAKQTCEAVMDLESLCNEIILEELIRDNDVGAGSLYMAIDFTKPQNAKYNKFTFECPWDFNWAYSPVKNDRDGGNYWKNKKLYFAGAWQSIYLLEDESDRSYPWFILFNNAPWFRKMLREKWERIDKDNLLQVLDEVDQEVIFASKDLGGGNSLWLTNFVRERIDYIDKYLWK